MNSNRRPEYFNFLSTASIDNLKSLDPSLVRVIVEYHLIHNLTNQLIELDQSGQYRPRLAERVVLSSDKKSLAIHLSSRTFSNGEPVTSEDVASTIKRLILRGSPHSTPKKFIKGASGLKRMTDRCEGIEIAGPGMITLRFNYPVKEIMYYLQLADYGILHKSQYAKDGDLSLEDWQVTSGPYSLRRDDGGYHLNWNDAFAPGDHRIRKIRALVSDGTDLLKKAIQKRQIHIGTIGFRDYYRLIQDPDAVRHVEMVGSKYTSVSVLLLNADHPKFKRRETRQWVMNRIMGRLRAPEKYGGLLEKAYEYFLPGAPGYVDPSEVKKIVESFKSADDVPRELRDGFHIRCRSGLATFLPEELESLLQGALGVKIGLDYDIPLDKYREIVKARDFEAMLLNPSMSYKVLGESLTLGYVTEPRHFLDPSGDVKTHLADYYQADEKNGESRAIRNILIAMANDSEVIPLYYNGYVKFYDKELLDAAEVSFYESFELSKYIVK